MVFITLLQTQNNSTWLQIKELIKSLTDKLPPINQYNIISSFTTNILPDQSTVSLIASTSNVCKKWDGYKCNK